MKKKMGFTLAEVLIVLAVLGIVAAVTLPTLNGNVAERQTIAKLAKARNTLENAINLAMINNSIATATNLTCEQLTEQIKGTPNGCTVETRDGMRLILNAGNGVTATSRISSSFRVDMDAGNNSPDDQYELSVNGDGDVVGTATTFTIGKKTNLSTIELLRSSNHINGK